MYKNLNINAEIKSDFKNPLQGSVLFNVSPQLENELTQTMHTFHDYEQSIQEDFVSLKTSFRALRLEEKKYNDFMQNIWKDVRQRDKYSQIKFKLEMSYYISQLEYTRNVIKLYDSLGLLYKKWLERGSLLWLYGI